MKLKKFETCSFTANVSFKQLDATAVSMAIGEKAIGRVRRWEQDCECGDPEHSTELWNANGLLGERDFLYLEDAFYYLFHSYTLLN
jgi:hypothetical protein